MKLTISGPTASTSLPQRPKDGEPSLRSVRSVPEQPTSASRTTPAQAASSTIKTTKSSGQPAGIRSLEQKINDFNTKPDTRLLVSTFNVASFNLDTFASNFIERSNAFNAGESGYTHVNFSGSLLEPGSLNDLYYSKPSRLNEPDSYFDWPIIFPKDLPQQQRQRLDELQASLNAADNESVPAARQALNTARLEILQDYPKILYHLPRLSIGYLVGDGALLQHALTKAGDTFNQRHHVIVSQPEGSKPKTVAFSDTYEKLKTRDKHFKIINNEVVARGHHETLGALSKHMKKHDPMQCTEILFGAPDEDLSHIVDAFFLDMRSGFEMMDIATVNLYLRYNGKEVLQKLEQIKDFPLLVNYTDKTSGLHKFAYVSLDSDGVPVATEPPTHAIESRPAAAEQGPDSKKPRSSLRALLVKVSGSPVGRLASSISQRFSRLRSHKTT